MGGTADPAADQSLAGKLGFKHGQLVQEFGYDDDVDDDLRESIEDVTGEELLDEDGDLVDGLVDVLTSVAEGGVIWLLTPKSGRPGHVEPSEIQEAAPIAGLHATKSISAGKDWAGTRLVAPSAGRKS